MTTQADRDQEKAKQIESNLSLLAQINGTKPRKQTKVTDLSQLPHLITFDQATEQGEYRTAHEPEKGIFAATIHTENR